MYSDSTTMEHSVFQNFTLSTKFDHNCTEVVHLCVLNCHVPNLT